MPKGNRNRVWYQDEKALDEKKAKSGKVELMYQQWSRNFWQKIAGAKTHIYLSWAPLGILSVS
jgi:hypothetical protein